MSIQVHPDKQTAAILHAKFPDIYKGNAILFLKALRGFRNQTFPWDRQVLNNTPELQALIPSSVIDNFLIVSGSSSFTESLENAALQTLFLSLMTAVESIIHNQLDISVKPYQSQATQKNDIAQLGLKLNEQFPGDIGILCPFFN